MTREARGDVLKVWLYAAASVLLGAWVTPLWYNAGKALAEVSEHKDTNRGLEWLARRCGEAELPVFYTLSVLAAALVLFVPWMEWLHAGGAGGGRMGPWGLRLRDGGRRSKGQPLARNMRGLWHCCCGFLLVGGLLLPMGVALVPSGLCTMRVAAEGNGALALRTLGWAFGLAVVLEVFFRGVVMGVFLRAMRPAAALGMSSLFFALAVCVLPWGGVNVVDPEASGTGFELLREIGAGLGDSRYLFGRFVPLVALGGVLSYVRWRTASLWMPVGLHAGWLFAKGILTGLTVPDVEMSASEWAFSGGLLQQGLVPMLGIFLAGMLAHFLTDGADETQPIAESHAVES